MKQRLKSTFGEEFFFTDICKKSDVATFRKKASTILHDFYKQTSANLDDDNKKETLIETAAKLLKEDIKLVETNHDLYPDLSATEVQEYLDFITYAI